eukprot:CAMPEP_0117859940 /NCGR_PEP_ID=MMETSP0950-20121206/3467_1 /TAXON_ID=44440 /ORGANISM="Chattonella subsalsa, Strain CCMP2191" /LENGTH=347 /DNA_ID=CAMNT_0005709979 /DNA_START=12 /DNA_END=1055 /DNA_ORIENTATION=+
MKFVSLMLTLGLLHSIHAAIAPPRSHVEADKGPIYRFEELVIPGREQYSKEISPAEYPQNDLKSVVVPGKHSLKLAFYLTVWYGMSIGYNVCTKRTFQMLPLPWIISSTQFFAGILYVTPLWMLGIRSKPQLTFNQGFVNIVKATEPIFSCIFARTVLKQHLEAPVYATLIPIILGVCLASLKEVSFSAIAFAGAIGSSISSALRAILAKKSLGKPKGKNMDALNLCAVLNILGFSILAPLALVWEGRKIMPAWENAMAAGFSPKAIVMNAFMSGFFLYMYYESNYLFLNEVSAVTHAVANVMRRILMVATSIVVFGTQVTPLNLFGSILACVGAFLYSFLKDRYSK